MIQTASHRARWAGVGLLGVGHGIGDFNAGALLAILGESAGSDLVITYLLYNAFAFAGQPFAGLICDRVGRPLTWFYCGGLLSAGSLLAASARPDLAVVCAGLASAFYHSSGGAVAWRWGGERALAAGCFSAPGVIGLALGMALGARLTPGAALLGGAAMVMILGLLWIVARKTDSAALFPTAGRTVDRSLMGGVLGWLVLLAIAARSFAWSTGQEAIFPPEDAVWLALSAAVGKCIAGFLADRWGAGLVTVVALAVAAALLGLGKSNAWFFFPAVTALQAATAPMMALVFRAWPRRPAFGSGLAQGLAVAVGGAPLLVLSRFGPFAIYAAVGALVFAAITVFIVNRTGRLRASEAP